MNKEKFINILEKLDKWIDKESNLAEKEGGYFPTKCQLLILGQTSLLIDEYISLNIELNGTFDVDANIDCNNQIRKEFDRLLRSEEYSLDSDANLIWIPKDSTREVVFTGKYVHCEKLDPISVLVSKAIKAPQKNRKLIHDSLIVLGEKLKDKIKENNGTIEFFQRIED